MHQKCSQKEAPVQTFLKDLVKGSKYLKSSTRFHSVSSMHQNFILFFKICAYDSSFLTDTPIIVFFEWMPATEKVATTVCDWAELSDLLFRISRAINKKTLMDGIFLSSNGWKINTLMI